MILSEWTHKRVWFLKRIFATAGFVNNNSKRIIQFKKKNKIIEMKTAVYFLSNIFIDLIKIQATKNSFFMLSQGRISIGLNAVYSVSLLALKAIIL